MTVLVVGGGIVGMVASYLMAARKRDVVLVEAAPHLGGLLRGPRFGDRSFDHGTHSLASTGVPEIDDFLLSGFPTDDFNLFSGHDSDQSGSFSAAGWNEETSFADARAESFAAAIVEWRSRGNEAPPVRSARDELQSLYGPEATPFFSRFLTSVFGRDPIDLGVNAVRLLALHRAVLMPHEDIESLPPAAQLAAVIAHPDRAQFNQRTPPDARSIYPKSRGLGRVIDVLEAKLEGAGVRIHKSATLERADNDFIASNASGKHLMSGPEVLWTAGVPGAANLFLNKKFNAVPGALVCWIAHVELHKKRRPLANHYYFVRHPELRTYRLTNYSALTLDAADAAYTLEITAPSALSEAEMATLVRSEMLSMGLVESAADVHFLQLTRLNYSFLNATVDFEAWCGDVAHELNGQIPLFGPWSSRGMFFTGDCLRDLYRRLPT